MELAQSLYLQFFLKTNCPDLSYTDFSPQHIYIHMGIYQVPGEWGRDLTAESVILIILGTDFAYSSVSQ